MDDDLARGERDRLRQCALAALVAVLGWGCAREFSGFWAPVTYLLMTAAAGLFVIDAGRSWDRIVALRRLSGEGRRPVVDGMALTGVAVSGLAAMCGLMTIFAA